MILFPRRAGKVKKGLVNDATVDRVKSAEAEKQTLAKHLLVKPVPKLREKPQKITKEMLAVKAFRKLRQARVNKKHKGQREKRAREQAEKEAAGPSKK